MNQAVIGFGSNIDPQDNIKQAKELIAENHCILAESKFATTKPIGIVDQPNFLNGAVLIETLMNCTKLKTSLKSIEKTIGRNFQTEKLGPRTIDLDIIIWNDKIVDQDFYKRDFVKNSVLELLPNLYY